MKTRRLFKTTLRELSVATTIGLLSSNIEFQQQDLYNSQLFFTYAQNSISTDISNARTLATSGTFTGELCKIIDNGYKLGKKIYESPHFSIKNGAQIQWLGNDTHKLDPVDISVDGYGFSLKEESFILQNMGLYSMLNILTGSNYKRGLHIFSDFAPKEYEDWFRYTWNALISYLQENGPWADNFSTLYLQDNLLIASYNNISIKLPVNITSSVEYIKHTNAKIREKVFSKWINANISCDPAYLKLKKICSVSAGKNVCNIINQNYRPDNIYDFFRIYYQEYYYAKTTDYETTILRVPNRQNFHVSIRFLGSQYEVPESQLNIISTFQNTHTGKILQFRNECRFSHGQFNGTPEAKMYAARTTNLTDLYEPLE